MATKIQMDKMTIEMTIAIASEYRNILLSTLENFECDTDAILEQWDSVVETRKDSHPAIFQKFMKTKRVKKDGPKRPKSAYIFFCQDKRAEVKEANPDMKPKEITSELGMMWTEIKGTEEVESYLELAKEDKSRYLEEVENMPPKSSGAEEHKGTEKKQRKTKTEGPKKPKSAYLFFCQEERAQVKEANPDMKPKEITSELGRQWNKIKDKKEVQKYIDMSNDDKNRYKEATADTTEVKTKKPKKNLPKKKGEEKKTRAKTAYSLFCQENINSVSTEFPDSSKKDIRLKLSNLWRQLKISNVEAVDEYNIRVRTMDADSQDEGDSAGDLKEEPEETFRGERKDGDNDDDDSSSEFPIHMLARNNTQVEMEDIQEMEIEEMEIEEMEIEELEDEDGEERKDSKEQSQEDPELIGAKCLLEYLEKLKAQKAKKGYKFNKQDFLEMTGELKLSEEVVEKINEFGESKLKIISTQYLDQLIELTTETIQSFE